MTIFNNLAEKLDFLKRYKLISKTKTELPTFYYYAPGTDIPVICEIVGYDETFDNWAVIVIKTNDRTINIHSTYLLEMKDRGTAYYKNKSANETAGSSDPKASYIVFDIETTGFSYPSNKIIEMAAVKYANGVVSEFHEYVNIDSIIPINITLLTGINNETIENADYIDIVMPKFLDFIGNSMLVGHNIKSFDIPFINKVCVDLGLPTVKNELTDTLYLAKEKLPELESHKLHDLCDFYKIDTSKAHHALFDCYMCNECYINLLDCDNSTQEVQHKYINNIDNEFEQQILDILNEIISLKDLPSNSLLIYSNVSKTGKITSKTLCIYEPDYPASKKITLNNKFANFIYKKNGDIQFKIKDILVKQMSFPDHITLTKKTQGENYTYITFSPNDSFMHEFIRSLVLINLAHYVSPAKTFSCCSKFNQCSDAKRCLHENKLYSTACTYRKNLESGRIFYGKNRNID